MKSLYHFRNSLFTQGSLSLPSLLNSSQSGRKSMICSVVWHLAKNEGAFCDLTGHWGLVHEVRAETAPVTADSQGVVLLLEKRAGVWPSLLDMRAHSKGRSDTHYFVAVSQVEWEARTILCRGSRYRIIFNAVLSFQESWFVPIVLLQVPPTLPRPLPNSLPLPGHCRYCRVHTCTRLVKCNSP